VISKGTVGTYRCPGPRDTWTDFAFTADVSPANPGSCAGVWFRFAGARGGYALRICPDRYELVTHAGSTITTLRTMRFAQPVPAGGSVHVGLVVQGQNLRVFQNGTRLGEVPNATFDNGRLILGIFNTEGAPPFGVTFANVEIWAPGGS
jgi:hypothetical protein